MKLSAIRYGSSIDAAVMLLLFSYPTLMLTLKGGMNTAFILLLLVTLVVTIKRPKELPAVVWRRDWTLYLLAMTGMSVAIFLSQLANHKFGGHAHDAATRYWLAIPIFLLLQRMPLSTFNVLQLTFPVAAIVGFLLANNIIGNVYLDLGGRVGISNIDLIHFGDFELLLGVTSLLSIDWFGHDKPPVRGLKMLGFIAGLLTSIATGSRGGWMAIPIFIVLFIYFNAHKHPLRLIASAALAIALSGALLFATNNSITQRFFETTNDVSTFDKGNRDTSTGIRLQLYKAAADVFMRHPIFGVGPQGFADEMQALVEAGKLTPLAANLGRGEVHNDLLSKAAGMGVLGVLAMLAIYLVPFYLFWKVRKSSVAIVKRAALIGTIFVAGHAVFGLTVEFLNLALATAFYSFTVAVLLALCYNRHHPEQASFNKDLSHV
ncbi:MAG: O-antigen ligase family protein [Sideroxydans sp.]|nr:O-antigen ligase family protein [Sideroxydans sp.]